MPILCRIVCFCYSKTLTSSFLNQLQFDSVPITLLQVTKVPSGHLTSSVCENVFVFAFPHVCYTPAETDDHSFLLKLFSSLAFLMLFFGSFSTHFISCSPLWFAVQNHEVLIKLPPLLIFKYQNVQIRPQTTCMKG